MKSESLKIFNVTSGSTMLRNDLNTFWEQKN